LESVQELVRLAGRHRRALQVAALGARQEGQHLEYSIPNVAHRLLQAALVGGPVKHLSDAEQQRIETIEEFSDADPERQWTELITAEPRLLALAAEARSGAYGHSERDASWLDLPEEQSKQTARDLLRYDQELRRSLDQLLGPNSGHDDILLASRTARDAAWSYLDELRGPRG
jgi:hypothetical protein